MNFRKQFYILRNSSATIELDQLHGFREVKFSNMTLFHSDDLNKFVFSDGAYLLGDLFFEPDVELVLNSENFLTESSRWQGRWVYVSESFIFTDFLSSRALFYSNNNLVMSSSLGIFKQLNLVDANLNVDKAGFKYYLPPGTMYNNIQQLMPGQYIDLHNSRINSFGKSFFDIKLNYANRNLDSLSDLSKSLTKTAAPYLEEQGYYQGLTGGVDSRLTLSMFLANDIKASTFTHSKPYLWFSYSDKVSPVKLSKMFNFDHVITKRQSTDFNSDEFMKFIGRDVDNQVGSNFYYFKSGQMDLLKNYFFLDNYYETAAKWMHGVAAVGKANALTKSVFEKDGYLFREEQLNYLLEHIQTLKVEGVDDLDVLYFLKNFSLVGNIFNEMDFYLSPIVHVNSREFFSHLLSTDESSRYNNKMLLEFLAINKKNLLDEPINRKEPFIKRAVRKSYSILRARLKSDSKN